MALSRFLFALLEDDEDCLALIDSDDDIFVLAAGSTVMRRSLSRIQGYFKETVPSYFDGNCRDRTAELKNQHPSNIIAG